MGLRLVTIVSKYSDALLEEYLSDVNKSVDIYVPSKKLIIECFGDYWHCNPSRYAADYYNRGKKKTAAEIWKRDEKRKRELESMGDKVLYFWEHEINNNIKDIKAALKRYIT